LWKYLAAPGDRVAAGATIAIVESMKMEIAVQAPVAGRMAEMRATPGRTLRAGDLLAVMEAD
jgi:urea carboxylase